MTRTFHLGSLSVHHPPFTTHYLSHFSINSHSRNKTITSYPTSSNLSTYATLVRIRALRSNEHPVNY
jgi:hypothetical protein